MPSATSPASSRALARAALVAALSDADLEVSLRSRAAARREEAEALSVLGASVAAARDELTRLQVISASSEVAESALQRLGRAVLDAGVSIGPVRQRRQDVEGLQTLEAELAALKAERGLVGRARTKARRVRLAGKIADRQREEAGADAALGRTLVAEGWLEAARSPDADDAIDAVLAALPPEASELAALRRRLQGELSLATLPTALDLRPLLSRTRASESAAREAAEGAETEAIEAAIARRSALPPAIGALVDALQLARAAEHEEQRGALEAQLAAIEGS